MQRFYSQTNEWYSFPFQDLSQVENLSLSSVRKAAWDGVVSIYGYDPIWGEDFSYLSLSGARTRFLSWTRSVWMCRSWRAASQRSAIVFSNLNTGKTIVFTPEVNDVSREATVEGLTIHNGELISRYAASRREIWQGQNRLVWMHHGT